MSTIPVDPARLVGAFGAAFFAGAVNSVAGGGTLISFPLLVSLGLPSVMANATSTVGIWPGSLGSIWAFRRELRRADPRLRILVLPCFVGGVVGALLLRATSASVFERLVPFLVLFATVLFAVRGLVQRWLAGRSGDVSRRRGWPLGGLLLTLGVGIYGGYFGAGMSIMNLSVLGLLGMTDLLEMNALTSLFSLCVNGVAIVLFGLAGLVAWPYALVMAAGALIGGYGAVGVARRIGKVRLGRFVIAVGAIVSATFFLRAVR